MASDRMASQEAGLALLQQKTWSPDRIRKAAVVQAAFAVAPAPTAALADAVAAVPAAVHMLLTPPHVANRAVPGTPPVVVEPAPGCTVEELRIWVLQKFDRSNHEAVDLETSMAARMCQINTHAEEAAQRIIAVEATVRASSAALNDVGVFGNIKNFVTEQSLQVRLDAFDLEIKRLQARGNEFSTHLEEHLLKLQGVETAFKGHVSDGFANVEKELLHIKVVLESAQANANGGEVVTAVGLQFEHLKASFQAENVALKSDLENMRAGVNAIQERVVGVSTAMAATKCHCAHVDELAVRITQFEAQLALKATLGHVPAASVPGNAAAGVQDPWMAFKTGQQSHPPVRSPPGMGSGAEAEETVEEGLIESSL